VLGGGWQAVLRYGKRSSPSRNCGSTKLAVPSQGTSRWAHSWVSYSQRLLWPAGPVGAAPVTWAELRPSLCRLRWSMRRCRARPWGAAAGAGPARRAVGGVSLPCLGPALPLFRRWGIRGCGAKPDGGAVPRLGPVAGPEFQGPLSQARRRVGSRAPAAGGCLTLLRRPRPSRSVTARACGGGPGGPGLVCAIRPGPKF